MKRTPLLRRTLLRAVSSLVTAKPLERSSALKRSAMRRKPRRAKPGDDAKYLAWVRSLFCLVGGPKKRGCRGRLDPHHMIGGLGAQKRGKSQTVSDANAIPLCRGHHEDFHGERGFCRNWTREGRRLWQEEEILRLNKAYEQLQLGEPFQEAI